MFTGEQCARATEPGGDLIGDQQHVVLITQLTDTFHEARRLADHPGGALHDRLDHHGGGLIGLTLQESFQFAQTVITQRPAQRFVFAREFIVTGE